MGEPAWPWTYGADDLPDCLAAHAPAAPASQQEVSGPSQDDAHLQASLPQPAAGAGLALPPSPPQQLPMPPAPGALASQPGAKCMLFGMRDTLFLFSHERAIDKV